MKQGGKVWFVLGCLVAFTILLFLGSKTTVTMQQVMPKQMVQVITSRLGTGSGLVPMETDENAAKDDPRSERSGRSGVPEVMERYRGCNQASMLCGGDTSWNNLSMEHAQRTLHRRLQNYQYKCRDRKRVGKKGDGGYEVCMDKGIRPQPDNCIVYSFGINNEWSFDEGSRKILKCVVHSFDPSMGKEDHEHIPGVHFHNLGLWGADITHPKGWKLARFSTIRKKLGHEKVPLDVVKIDVEGGEWPAIRDMLIQGELSDVKQLILEIHAPRYSNPYTGPPDPPMSLPDLAEVYNYYTSLSQDGFLLYWMRDVNYCCARFHVIVSASVRGRGPKLCCYETFLINSRYLPTH